MKLPALCIFAALLVTPSALAQAISDGTPDFTEPPAPPAGTSRVAFYGYVFASTLGSPMPANTQYPWGVADWGSSLVDTPINCGPEPGYTSCDEYDINKIVLFSTAGPVQVKSTSEYDVTKLHNENGLSQVVVLDQTQDVTATIHMSAAAHAWPHNEDETPCIFRDPPQSVPCLQPYWRWHSGINPNIQIRAWLYGMNFGAHGADADRAPPVESILDSGEALLIATGQTKPTHLISADGASGNERVWRFDVNLGKSLVSEVPREMNLVLVYSWHNVLPDGTEVGISNPPRINTGEFFPTIFTVPVRNPFTIELVAPLPVHEKLAIIGVMNTPWGSYDVDPKSIRLAIRGPSGTELDTSNVKVHGDYSVAHGGHYRPINLTFVWDYQAAKVRSGVHEITVSACNFQRSACDERTAKVAFDDRGRIARTEPGVAPIRTFTEADLANFKGGSASSQNLLGVQVFPLLDELTDFDSPAEVAGVAPQSARQEVPFPGVFLAFAALAAVLIRRRLE